MNGDDVSRSRRRTAAGVGESGLVGGGYVASTWALALSTNNGTTAAAAYTTYNLQKLLGRKE